MEYNSTELIQWNFNKIDWEPEEKAPEPSRQKRSSMLIVVLSFNQKVQIYLTDLLLFPHLVHKDMVKDPDKCLLKLDHILFTTFHSSASLIPCQKENKAVVTLTS